MTNTTNGWPGKPGVPLNPKQNGAHKLGQYFVVWRADTQDYVNHNGNVLPPEVAGAWPYLGPCLTPDEVANREDVKWHEGYAVGVLDVRRGTAFGEPDPHYAALQARVAELEEELDAAGRILHKAGQQFSEYAKQHAAKSTAVSDLKAAANKQWAEWCFSAYWRAVEGGKDE